MGRNAFAAGDSGFAGGSLGIGASNVVNEDEQAETAEGMMTPLGRSVLEPGKSNADEALPGARGAALARRALVGVEGARSSAGLYASSVEMVTTLK